MFPLFKQIFLLEIFIVSDLVKKLGGGDGNQNHKLVSMVQWKWDRSYTSFNNC